MAKQLNIDLNVQANTSQARTEFQNLQKALSDVATSVTKVSNTKMNTAQLKEASMAAQELQRHLNNAVDVNTGKLNLNKLNTSLKQSKANIGELSAKILSTGTSGQQAFLQLAQSIAAADRPVVTMGSHLNGLLTTLKNTARWQISSTILHGFMGSISKAYNYAKDLNKSLNDIRIVTGQNTDQMAKFAEAANKSAKELSTTTTAYTKASLIYYQQGLSDEEVKKRTDTTIKLANVSRQSSEEVSSQMTAIWNNFAKDGENLEYYADVITKLGASTASSSSEIAEGLQKFAAVADTVGLSYDKAAASVATVVAETRQSADIVGTAFKTMFARIEGLKLGETLEDGVDLNKYSEALKVIGVNILDANKQIKSMDTILDEIGQRWNKIGESEKIAVSETVAGVRQYTQFMSLMNNYDKVKQNESLAEGASGTLQEQADIYAESWDAASKRVQASLETVYQALLDDKFFIGLANGFATLLEGVNQFIKGIGGVYPLIIGLGAIFMSHVANKIQPALTDLKISLTTMFQSPMKQAETYQTMMENILSKAKNASGLVLDNFSTSAKVGIEYADQLSIAKNKLMVLDKQLTAEEKQVYESGLMMIGMYQKEVQTIADKVTKEEEAITALRDSMEPTEAMKEVESARAGGLAILEQQLANVRVRMEEVRNAGNIETYQELQKKYYELIGAISSYNDKTNEEIATTENLGNALLQGYENFVALDEETKNTETIIVDLGQYLGETAGAFEKLTEGMSGSEAVSGEILENFEALQTECTELGLDKIPEVRKAFQSINFKNADEAKTQIKTLGEMIAGLKIKITKTGDAIGTMSFKNYRNFILKDFKVGKKNVDNIDNSYNKLNKDVKQLDAAQQRLNQAFANFNPKHMMSGVEVFTKISSAGMSAAMAIQSVRSMWNAWSNDDLSIGEKITTSLMSIGMITPSVIGAFNSIKTVIQGLIASEQAYKIAKAASKAETIAGTIVEKAAAAAKGLTGKAASESIASTIAESAVKKELITAEQKEFAQKVLLNAEKTKGSALNAKEVSGILAAVGATNADTVAKGADASATEVATTAQWGLNAAMDANPIGAIIAAVVALIAVLVAFTAITIAVANAESEEEKAVKKANEELKKSKEEAELAKQAYEDLKNKISNYKTAVDALKQYTKGTKEWRDAMQEVLNKVNELIQKYPSLLTYSNLFNTDGTLNEDVLDEAETEMQKSSLRANMKVLKNTAKLYEAEYQRDYKNATEVFKTQYQQNSLKGKVDYTLDDITINKIVTDIINNKDIDNFSDEKAVSKAVTEFLNNSGEKIPEDKLSSIVSSVTTTISGLNTNLTTLSNESEKTAAAFINASKMIAEEFYGDSLDSSDPYDLLAGELALQNYVNENEKKLSGDLNAASMETISDGLSFDVWDIFSFGASRAFKAGKQIFAGNDIKAGDEKYPQFDDMAAKYLAMHPEINAEYEKAYTTIWGDRGNSKFHFKGKDGTKDFDITFDEMAEENAAYDAEYKDKDKILVDKESLKNGLSPYNAAAISYMANGNLNGAKVKNVLDLDISKLFGDGENQINDDTIKNILAKQKGVEVSKITDDEVTSYKKTLENMKTEAIKTIDEIPEYMKEKMGKDFVDSLDMETLPKVYNMYTKAFANEGQQGVDYLNDIKEKAGDEAGAVMKALSDIDLASADTDSINASLKQLGIQCELSETEVYNLKAALLDTTSVTAESAKETYKNISKIVSKIKKEGDTIEDEEYKKLIQLNPAIESCFTTLADGTHMLTGEVTDFKKAMQTASLNQLYTAQKNQEETALAYGELSNGNYTYVDQMSGYSKDENGKVSITGDNNENWNKYSDQIEAQLKVLKDNGKDDIVNKYQAMINKGKEYNEVIVGVASAYEDLNLTTDDYADKAADAAEEANKLAEAIKEQIYSNEVSNANLDYETTENYANVLMELYEDENLSQEAARELAIANQRLDRGLSDLNDNFTTWQNTLQKTSKSSAEYASTIGKVRDSFADLLNVSDGKELSLSWVESWMNNTSKMTAILDGNADAIQEFRESAFTEMTTNVFSDMKDSLTELLKEEDKIKNKDYVSDMQNLLDALDSGKFSADNLRSAIQDLEGVEVGAGAKLSDEYVTSLNKMLAEGLITEEQMNDLFATIGYKPKVTTKQVDQWVEVPIYKTYETEASSVSEGDVTGIDGADTSNTKSKITWTEQIGTKKMKQSVPVTQIVSDDTEGGNIEIVNAGSENIIPSYGSTTTGKSDTGSNNTSAASHEHNVNRYSNEENAINGLSKQYDRLSKAKDAAFGMSRVQAIEKEIKKLKELKEASGDYLEIIAGKSNAGKIAKAIQNGKNIGKLISSGSLGGTIGADFKSLSGGLSASGKGLEYTSKDKDGNEQLISTKYSLGEFNSLFKTNVNFSLDSFGNLQNKDSLLNLLDKLHNNEEDAFSKNANPTGAQTTEHNKRLAYLEEMKERIEQYNSTAETLSDKVNEYLDYISQIQEANAEKITTKMETGVELGQKTTQRIERSLKVLGDNIYKNTEAMSKWFTQTFKNDITAKEKQAESYDQAYKETEEGWKKYTKKNGEFDENAIDSAHATEILSSIEDGYDSLIDDILSKIETGKEYYGKVMEYWKTKISAVTEQIEQNAQTLSHYQKVLELTGKSSDYKTMDTILAGQMSNSKSAYEANKRLSDDAEKEYQDNLKEYKRMKKRVEKGKLSQDALDDFYENNLEVARKNRDEALSATQTSLEDVLEKVNAWYTNKINQVFHEAEVELTGKWGSFDLLDQSMSRQKSIADEYLTKTNQLYETNSMLRSLQNDIDKTDNAMAKSKLNNFASEIKAMKEKNNLTKAELDIAKARYEVLQAQIALEEAQNAKNTVRLQRDNEGNYGYVYTADQDKVSEAQQALEDKQNALYNLVLGQTQDYAQQIKQLEAEHSAALQEIANQEFDSLEAKEAAIEEVNKQFYERREVLLRNHNEAIVWLDQTAATDRSEAWTNSYEETIQDQDNYKETVESLCSDLKGYLSDLDEERSYYVEQAGLDNEHLAGTVKKVTTNTKNLKDEIAGKDGLIDQQKECAKQARKLTEQFYNQYDQLKSLISKYQTAADKVNNLYQQVILLTKAQKDYNQSIKDQPTPNYQSSGTVGNYGSNNLNNDNSLNIKQTEEKNKDKKYIKVKAVIHGFEGTYYVEKQYWDENDIRKIKKNTPRSAFLTENGKELNFDPYSNIDRIKKIKEYDTGGYTGTWAGLNIKENGKLAFLHQKELVLNAEDTENILNAVQLIRQISEGIDLSAAAQSHGFQIQAAQYASGNQTLQQEVTIHAEFPNVSDHNEIEEAFNNLVNRATQYANRE